ncbi:MAG TPA: hypothetical protein VH418_21280, partial [Solirubrobacteraceae bacterium]
MPLTRTFAAAAVTLAALGLLAAIALGAGGTETPPAQPAATPKPEVRTVVIRRTVRVHRKRNEPARAAAPAPAPAPAPPPAAPAPVTSASSSGDDGDHSGHGRVGGDDDDSG